MFGINGAEKNKIVGMSVTANLGLEACVYNRLTNQVEKYATRPLDYNIASKEIQDMNAYRNVITDILNAIGVSKDEANIYMVLPNVHFGFKSVEDPAVLDDEIESMIIQNASESYIFKQEESISSWEDVNKNLGTTVKYIAHSSFQRRVVDAIQDAIMDIGGNIVGIESSTTAIPRGIALTGFVDDLLAQDENWNILLINPNGYAVFQMAGNRLVEYNEIPFAIMSYEGDEIYDALSVAIKPNMPKFPARKLIVTSLTDNVSAEKLKKYIYTSEEVIAVDSNANGRKVIMPISHEVDDKTAQSMSLAVLGAAVPKFAKMTTLNFIGDVSYDGIVDYGTIDVGGKVIDVNSSFVQKASLGIVALFVFFFLVVGGASFGMMQYFKSQTAPLTAKTKQLEAEVQSIKSKLGAGVDGIIKQILANNKDAINYYDSLASDIPTNLWLTYYINEDGKNVGIEGYALDIKDIYSYYKSLKSLAIQSNIKLNKLEVFKDEKEEGDNKKNNSPDAIDPLALDLDSKVRLFTFEISNMTYKKSFDDKGNAAAKEDDKSGGSKSSVPITGGESPNAGGAPVPSKGNTPNTPGSVPSVDDVEVNLKEIK